MRHLLLVLAFVFGSCTASANRSRPDPLLDAFKGYRDAHLKVNEAQRHGMNGSTKDGREAFVEYGFVAPLPDSEWRRQNNVLVNDRTGATVAFINSNFPPLESATMWRLIERQSYPDGETGGTVTRKQGRMAWFMATRRDLKRPERVMYLFITRDGERDGQSLGIVGRWMVDKAAEEVNDQDQVGINAVRYLGRNADFDAKFKVVD